MSRDFGKNCLESVVDEVGKRALGWFQDLVENPVEIFSVDFVVEAAARIFQFNFRLKAVFPCVGKRSPYRTVAQFIL